MIKSKLCGAESARVSGQDRVMNEETRSQSCKDECVETYAN